MTFVLAAMSVRLPPWRPRVLRNVWAGRNEFLGGLIGGDPADAARVLYVVLRFANSDFPPAGVDQDVWLPRSADAKG